MAASPEIRAQAADLLRFLDASPSPWHAVDSVSKRLLEHGYVELEETARWQLAAGGRYFVVRGGSSIIAFALGSKPLTETGCSIVGAHTDSPGLRLKPQAEHVSEGMLRLGVEVYGGPILATFTDRDLALAGRVIVRGGDSQQARLLRFDQPLARLPNLAIHMNREVNEQGLKLHKQQELPLLLARGVGDERQLLGLLAQNLGVAAHDILSFDLAAYDTQPAAFWGAEQEFIASARLDNLASCHAGLSALLAVEQPQTTAMCAFFDHEEVGSTSAAGADGSFVSDVLRRLMVAAGLDEQARYAALARSFFISADMAHAYHPNFPNAYEPNHKAMVNGGPVIKSNANQRYSTTAETAARFIGFCERAGVPYQQYAHRTDLGCGSTIGPLVAARLGVPTVDVGSPMWAMHSIRESAGVIDHAQMIAALTAAFSA